MMIDLLKLPKEHREQFQIVVKLIESLVRAGWTPHDAVRFTATLLKG